MIEWKTERWAVSKLKDWAKNPRRFTAKGMEDLKASMTRLGYIDPIAINQDGTIIGGHARKKMLKELGLKEIDVRVPDRMLTDKEIEEAVIRLNKNVAGEWNFDTLANEFNTDDLIEWGFAAEELGITVAPTEGLTDPDDVPEPPAEPVSKPGDVWVLGNHRLMCGDSTSIDAVEKLMDGDRADQLITDPPYNVAYQGKTKDALTIQNDSMGDDQFRQFLRDAFTAADAVMKPGAVFYIWHADLEGYNFRGACKDMGWQVRQCLVWAKDSMVMGRQDYHWKHEPCLYGWKEGAGHLWATDRKQTTILNFQRPNRNDIHPTMKPVELIQYQVLNNTKGEDIVLDLFGGSGTTMIACEMNGRHSRLMELDPKYCDVIIKRWQDFTGKEATHAETGKPFNAHAALLAKGKDAA